MPEFHLTDSILTSLNAQEPWPDNVKLFQPYEVEQILLPDNASCLAVQAFLKMCNLPFEVEMRWNAEFMSPSGRVPFIKCGAFVVSELEPIVQFAANKGVTLCGNLSTEEKAEMRAYMSLINNVLVNAELYISWLDNDTYNQVTKVRNSSVYPWPLGWLQTRSKRNAVTKRLKALHWHDKTLDQVLADVEQCCNSLSQRLGDKDYFFGSHPTPLDALVFGHMRAILSAQGPKAGLMIKTITTSLLRHIVRVVSITGMKLTTQEDYLISQAFQMTRRRLSPDRASERSARVKKSKIGISNDNSVYNRDSMFGFKPFASKQIIIMNTKEGLTCTYEHPYKHTNIVFRNEENYNFAIEIIEDIIDKIEEIAFDMFNDKMENYAEKNDFEIVYPNANDKVCYDNDKCVNDHYKNDRYVNDHYKDDKRVNDHFNVDKCDDGYDNDNYVEAFKMNEYLEIIDEVTTNTTVSFEVSDIIHVINDHNDIDSDGLINDKLLSDCDREKKIFDGTDLTDSSIKHTKDSLTVSGSGDQFSSSVKSDISRTPMSSGSKTGFTRESEEISVESLLKRLRQKNAYDIQEFNDID